MGGNALKLNSRLNKAEYLKLTEKIKFILNKLEISYLIPASYADKETFGDLDIIVYEKIELPFTFEFFVDNFKSTKIKFNNNIISFEFENFQIDFILVHDKVKLFSYYNYLSYNDLGNLIGKIAHKLGFKYSQEGLFYIILDKDNKTSFLHEERNIFISDDINKILYFLGFDAKIFNKGYNSLKEIFEFVVFSKYFDPKIYLFENLNNDNKRRDSKRQTYLKFLDYIKESNFNFLTVNYEKLKQEKLNQVDLVFTEVKLKEKIESFNNKLKLYHLYKTKFNGEIISKYTELQDKQLGKYFALLNKKYCLKDDNNLFNFIKKIISLSEDDIKNFILNEYNLIKIHNKEYLNENN